MNSWTVSAASRRDSFARRRWRSGIRWPDEIRNLQQLNAQMAQEALNLTRALKGDNKTQGNWGESSQPALEAWLREGYEYQTQVSAPKQKGRSRTQPDVIVRLPQGKDVVIDAKMTLVAYERYFNAEDDYTREAALQEHIASGKTIFACSDVKIINSCRACACSTMC